MYEPKRSGETQTEAIREKRNRVIGWFRCEPGADHKLFPRLHRHLREARSFHVTRQDFSRQRAVRSPRQKESILNVVNIRPQSSTRAVANHVSVSRQAVCRVLSENRLHLCHFQRVQALNLAICLLRLPVGGTAIKCWEQWTRKGTHTLKTGSGATNKTTRREDRKIVRQALVDPTVTRSTRRADVGVSIVPQTISRHLAEANLKSKRPFHALPLTPEHRQLRLQ
ncbi:HTH_Tnp_Tc3_2 domain-containing protein [Trichonephila clavipes]|nr:HTH_Tnp_Tc3_2 domain-containing protein [Trichonephila clavipes]